MKISEQHPPSSEEPIGMKSNQKSSCFQKSKENRKAHGMNLKISLAFSPFLSE